MPTGLKTENRWMILESPLGPDKFFVRSMSGTEGLSRLFQFDLDLLSSDEKVDLDKIVGKNVTLKVLLKGGKRAFLNGIVSRLRQSESTTAGMQAYRAQVVPWTWLLTREIDSRIFQGMTVPDIIQKVIKDSGIAADTTFKLKGTYAAREYCVQYRESDFNFISRLMEEEGIFYFFDHGDGKHSMVLGDRPDVHPLCPQESEFELVHSSSSGNGSPANKIQSFEIERAVASGVYCSGDYNFQTPTKELQVKTKGKDPAEIYEFPGCFDNRSVGEQLARIRLEEQEWQRRTAIGTADCRSLRSGHRFKLKKSHHDGEFLLLEVRHQATQEVPLGAVIENGHGEGYHVDFTGLEAGTPFRPPRQTPAPRIHGTQTAVVVGKAGEEIWTDKYGRVKVQFFWDRIGKRDENSSCWIRCAYGVSGKGWGQLFIPRIGQEVLVAFLEGDPNRPIIIAGVYNDEQMPPYSLPADQTKSTIKSRSSKGGGPANFNEIRFEDKLGSEELYVHAEKNYTQVTEHDRAETVGNDRSLQVARNKSESVGSNQTISVGGTKTETVALASAETIGLAKALTIGGAFQVSVGAAMNETVAGFKSEEVGAYRLEAVAAAKTTKVGDNFTVTVDKKYALEGRDQVEIKSGAGSLSMKKDGKIEIQGTDVTFKTTAGLIHIDAGGIITIKGSMVKVNT